MIWSSESSAMWQREAGGGKNHDPAFPAVFVCVFQTEDLKDMAGI